MSPSQSEGDVWFLPSGQVLAGISNSMVRLYRELFGKGPTGAKTYMLDDLVICVMRDGLTTVEKTLLEQGRGDAVREMRAAFQDAVSDRFTGAVEELTGRTVLAFMSQAHVAPDLAIEVFFLDGTVAANGSHEMPASHEEGTGMADPSSAANDGPELTGEHLRQISSAIVGLYSEHFGKGPTGAKAYVLDDMVICVLRDGLTTVEKTLFERGKGDVVREMRAAFQDAVADRFTSTIERLTDRKVIAFMSQNHIDPDLAVEVFVL